MVIQDICSLAFYCQRCGKIHIHDIPYFSGERRVMLHCDSCSYVQAVILRRSCNWLEISVTCVGCHTVNTVAYSLKQLRRLQLEKVYCVQDHFELGYLGRRRCIEELLAFNQAEFEALHPSDGKNFIEKQQILLEAVNRVHDIAAHGAIACPCGCKEIAVDIQGSSIVLECYRCGSYYVLPAANSADLMRLEKNLDIDLIAPDIMRKK